MTDLSVLTIVRNRQAHFDNLVEGLRRSSRRPDELVVVDMSDVWLAPPSTDFPISMIRLETEGLPLAVARNRAAAVANGEHLLFLDVDCIPLTDCLATLHAALVDHDALICADVRYLGPDDTRGSWTDATLLDAGQPHPARMFPATGIRREPNPGLFWSVAFAVRRARFEALGGFDERFTGYGAEDTDFGFRANAAKVPLLFVGGAVACHQHHAVFDPPLQHFDDIVRNARQFRSQWGVWPMEGWLAEFERVGLVALDDNELSVLRVPTRDEIEQARRS
ncbi:glycosyltransferase [Sphingomonas sp. SUN019]|uniref:glycosyltransferase family 2 protein n=1 Tax=Sphingomonas sp. SUN019 TaxID=2937788 RepID=UPI0021643B07|nr:glycosyltransferase [Sphingomonas sp. SUN019]UVO50119.1 glycosyltransferase [Sphingomonas sp. SUN019]